MLQNPPNARSILGLSDNYSAQELVANYRKLSLQWHPDRWIEKYKGVVKQIFQQIGNAKDQLENRHSSQAPSQAPSQASSSAMVIRDPSKRLPSRPTPSHTVVTRSTQQQTQQQTQKYTPKYTQQQTPLSTPQPTPEQTEQTLAAMLSMLDQLRIYLQKLHDAATTNGSHMPGRTTLSMAQAAANNLAILAAEAERYVGYKRALFKANQIAYIAYRERIALFKQQADEEYKKVMEYLAKLEQTLDESDGTSRKSKLQSGPSLFEAFVTIYNNVITLNNNNLHSEEIKSVMREAKALYHEAYSLNITIKNALSSHYLQDADEYAAMAGPIREKASRAYAEMQEMELEAKLDRIREPHRPKKRGPAVRPRS